MLKTKHATLEALSYAPDLQPLLERACQKHKHLCPRQVLGVRIGLAGAAALAMDVPRQDKTCICLVETDGCFVSGVEAATGLSVNRRTMRIYDYGKIAATFVNVKTKQAVRLAPKPQVRELAWEYAPKDETRRYFAMLYGYQVMPSQELFSYKTVTLTTPIEQLVSRPGVRVNCDVCQEEIINEREIIGDKILCRACAGLAYYK